MRFNITVLDAITVDFTLRIERNFPVDPTKMPRAAAIDSVWLICFDARQSVRKKCLVTTERDSTRFENLLSL